MDGLREEEVQNLRSPDWERRGGRKCIILSLTDV